MADNSKPASAAATPQTSTTAMPTTTTAQVEAPPPGKEVTRSWWFWMVFVALCLISFLAGLDASIVVTALPTIVDDLDSSGTSSSSGLYVWVANSFLLAGTALLPLYAQAANIFGRRNPMMVSMALFALGSGVAGGAVSLPAVIAGRTLQGLGAGGAYVLLDVILSDLVPLRERAKYLGLMNGAAAVGTLVGPPLGGALAERDWRWVFWLNVPVAGAALVSLFFMRLGYRASATWGQALRRVDWVGHLLFSPSVVAVMLGLVRGGVAYPWGSWQIVVPLVVGVLGWIAFHVSQFFAVEPSMPPRLFGNRTSVVGYIVAFVNELILFLLIYFLPIYFQAVLGSSPSRASVQFLPICAGTLPGAIVAGIIVEKVGKYKVLQFFSFAAQAIALGLFTLLEPDSSAAAWAGYQLLAGIGTGAGLACTLTVILVALPEGDVATATGAYSFLRQFGSVWGVTVAAITFNGEFDRYAHWITDDGVRSQLTGGQAYALTAGGEFTNTLTAATRDQVRSVYMAALHTVWRVGVAFAVFGFLLVFIEKEIELRKTLNTEFGLSDDKGKMSDVEKSDQSSAVAKESGPAKREGKASPTPA